jgi:hypothetical protein
MAHRRYGSVTSKLVPVLDSVHIQRFALCNSEPCISC